MRIEVPARRPGGIRLTPLIDVVFILLVFFMLASSFLDWRGFDLGLPPADAKPDPDTVPIVISVASGGALRVAGEPVAAQGLVERIQTLRSAEAERPVIVQPRGDTRVQATIDVLDRLRGAGIARVSMASRTP